MIFLEFSSASLRSALADSSDQSNFQANKERLFREPRPEIWCPGLKKKPRIKVQARKSTFQARFGNKDAFFDKIAPQARKKKYLGFRAI